MVKRGIRRLAPLLGVMAVSVTAVLAGAVPALAQTVAKLTLMSNDAVYVPQTGRLYSSVPGNAPSYANTVVAIDPATATVVGSVFVGSEPGRLAVSGDGTKLYVGLNGAGAVRVVDLPAFTAGLQFSLPSVSSYPCTDRFAADIAIQPGTNSVAAVVIGCLSSSGYDGVAVFDGGTMRPGALSAVYAYRTIAFGSSAVLYAYDNYSSGWEFTRLRVDATGLSVIDTADGLLSGYGILLRSAGGRAYSSTGTVFDPAGGLALSGRFPVTSVYDTTLDVSRNLGFVLRDTSSSSTYKTIAAYDLNTFVPLHSIDVGDVGSLSTSYANRSTLLTCGTTRFAVRANTAISVIDVAGVPTTVFRLRVDKKGTGTGVVRASSGSVNCGATCDGDYAQGTELTLVPTADSGSVFAGWSGSADCADGAVTIDSPLACVATFTSQAAAGSRPMVQRLALRAGDLYYDAPTNHILAGLLGANGPLGNSLVAINPDTGEPSAPTWIGSEPVRLAMSDDREFLYVGLDGASSIARFRTTTGAIDQRFPLAGDYEYKRLSKLRVQPGNNQVVVAGRTSSSVSGSYTIAYDAGVPMPNVLDWFAADAEFDFGSSPSTIYARTYGDGSLLRVFLSSTGLSIQSNVTTLPLGGSLTFSGGRLFTGAGPVIDPVAGTILGNLGGVTSSMVVDSAADRAMSVKSKDSSTATITAYDLTTYLPLWSVDVPLNGASSSGLGRLISVGSSGVAFLTDGSIFIVDLGQVALPTVRLRVDRYGTGMGTVTASSAGLSCGATCTADLAPGTTVTLSASAASGSTFAGWAGDEDCADGAVTMAAARSCTAVFNATGAAGAVTRRVALRAGDLLYDRATGLLHVSLKSGNGSLGNSIAAIDPATGLMSTPVWVGSEPSALAMSDDRLFLYVGLDGASSIARFAMAAGGVDMRFPLLGDYDYPNVAKVRVQPGNNQVVVAGRKGSSSGGLTMAYDGGVPRANGLQWSQADPEFDFGASPSQLYGRSYGGGSLLTISLSTLGLAIDSTTSSISPSGSITYANGRLYTGTGQVIDPVAGTLVGKFTGFSSSLLAPDAPSSRAVTVKESSYANGAAARVLAFDMGSYLPVWTADVPLSPSSGWTYVRRVVALGESGAAFLTDDAIYIVDAAQAASATERLRVDKYGTGSGTVAASPGGISCGSTCTGDFAAGTVVTLTATAATGSAFFGWSGDEDCADGVVAMTSARACTARFDTTAALAPAVRRLPLRAGDLVLDPVTGLLYVSISSSNGRNGNSVAAINPATGQMSAPVWVGSEPGKLAVSDDGQRLYVSFGGTSSISRLALPSFAADLNFSTGSSSSLPVQMRVQPGNRDVLLTALGSGTPLAAFDRGVKRTGTGASGTTFDFGGGATTVYGKDYSELVTMSLSASGLQIVQRFSNVFSSSSGTIEYDGGRVYASSGAVYNPTDGTKTGTFTGPSSYSSVMPDTGANTVFFLNEKSGNSSVRTLAAFDATTFVPAWSTDIPLGASAASGTARSFLRWGATGVAFLTDDAVIIAEYTGFPASKTLRVTKAGTGSGTVSSPDGIDCGSTCAAQMPPNLTVTLVAIPSGRSVFAGWSGDADCRDGVVTMSAAVNCAATFSSNPITFTDDPLAAGSTRVKAAHVVELRQRIDELRARYNLGAFAWTDATIVPGVTTMKAAHLADIRAAVSEVYAAAGRETPYFAASLVPGVTTIGAAHIQELRAAVGGIW